MNLYNCHTHIFSTQYVPDNVVGQQDHLGGLTKFLSIRKISRWNPAVLNIAGKLFGGWPGANRVITFAKIGLAATQEKIFDQLVDYYTPWGDVRFVVLTMDMEMMQGGPVPSNLLTQLDEIIRLRSKGNNADRILPFICIDPRNPRYLNGDSIVDFVKPYFEKYGFIGIKLYPALGYFPQDAKMFPLYRWCANNCVPIITHCITGVIHYRGDVSALPPVNSPGNVPYVADNNSSDPKIYQRNFTQPRNYSAILSEIPNLKICLAHYGDDKELIAGKGWPQEINALIQKYPNVYTDMSYIIENTGTFPAIQKSLSTPVLEDRVLFGTDYYVVSKAKLENELANDFRSYMIQQNLHTLFLKSATTNAQKFLSSKFYTAP